MKNVRKSQKRLQEVSADEKGRSFQAVAFYCGTSPTGSNTTKWQICGIVEVLEEIHWRISVGRNMPSGISLSTWTSCRPCPCKESKFWPKEFAYVVPIEVSF